MAMLERLHQLPMRSVIQERLRELLYIEVYSAPAEREGNLFFTHRTPTQEKSVYKMLRNDGQEQTVLDPHTLSEDLSTSVGVFSPSPDGQKVAYSLKEDNADEAVLYVMDLKTGESSDRIEGAKYAWPSWLPDSSGFYYTYLPTDPSIPTDERPGYADIRLHVLGTPSSEDPVVHPNTGSPQTFIGPSVSRDGRWLFVTIHHGWNRDDVFRMDLQAEKPVFEPLQSTRLISRLRHMTDSITFSQIWMRLGRIGPNPGGLPEHGELANCHSAP